MIECIIIISSICIYMTFTFGLPYLFFNKKEENIYAIAWIAGLVLYIVTLILVERLIYGAASEIPASVYEQLITRANNG